MAFLSCWSQLSDANQDELVGSLLSALEAPTIPAELLQIVLNLARLRAPRPAAPPPHGAPQTEFMERSGSPLPINASVLGSVAEKCHAYAKALHYKARPQRRAAPCGRAPVRNAARRATDAPVQELEFLFAPKSTLEALIRCGISAAHWARPPAPACCGA